MKGEIYGKILGMCGVAKEEMITNMRKFILKEIWKENIPKRKTY